MVKSCRDFLKDSVRKKVDFSQTGLSRDGAEPTRQKPCRPGERTIALAPVEDE